MAITFAEVAAQGKDAYAALAGGTMITSFTYALQEAPEILQDMIIGYSDPLMAQFKLEAGIANGSTKSDQDRWYEAGRLQNSYERTVEWVAGSVPLAGASGTLQFPVGDNFDIRKDQTIWLSALSADITGVADLMEEFFVVSVDTATKQATVQSRQGTSSGFVVAATATGEVMSVSHGASDYKQGSSVADESVTHEGTWISNNPIIMKDYQKYDRSKIQQMVSFLDDGLSRYTVDTRAMDKRFEAQQILALIFGKKSLTGTLLSSGIYGSESLVAGIQARGNTAAGTFASKTDLEDMIVMLNSVKGARNNKLMVNLAKNFELDNTLGGINGDFAAGFDFGSFSETVDYRKLSFEGYTLGGGWNFAKKHWDLLDDTTYFGAHAGNDNVVSGILIPEGQVETFSGGSVPYLNFKYRDGMDKVVGKEGNLVGVGHGDFLGISYTTEATLVGANLKDFCLFQG